MANTRIDSATGIDKVKPGTVGQASLAPNVAGNGPCFRYRATGGTPLGASVFTKVLYQTKVFDTGDCFNPATGRFQPNVAGHYYLGGGCFADSLILVSGIFKNESPDTYGPQVSAAKSTAAGLVYLNGTTDYADFRSYVGTAGNSVVDANSTIFYGFLARAA